MRSHQDMNLALSSPTESRALEIAYVGKSIVAIQSPKV